MSCNKVQCVASMVSEKFCVLIKDMFVILLEKQCCLTRIIFVEPHWLNIIANISLVIGVCVRP